MSCLLITALAIALTLGVQYTSPSEATETASTPVSTPEEEVSATTTLTNISPEPQWNMENCSCVTFMRIERGHDFPRINTPADLQPNSTPVIGGLILFTFSGWPHIGEIVDLRPGGAFILHRYLSGEECITTTGFIEWDKIQGVYRPELDKAQ